MIRQSRPTVLLTRPLRDSTRFAARLEGPVLISPLTEVRYRAADLPQAAAVIFTSANAVGALGGQRPASRAWCVGDRTARVARAAGFDAISAGGDVESLFDAIRTAGEGGPLLHLRGQDSRGDLARRLTEAGIPTVDVVVYHMASLPLSVAAQDLLAGDGTAIVPLFSPLSAQRFARYAAGARARLVLACLSGAVAAVAPAQNTRIAARPDADAMVDLVTALQRLETLPAQG